MTFTFCRSDFRKTAEADFFQDLVDELIKAGLINEHDVDTDTVDVEITAAC